MTNEQILKQAIEKAEENGFEISESLVSLDPHEGEVSTSFNGIVWMSKEKILFSHDFAKAFIKYLLSDEFLTKPYGVMRVKKLGFKAGRKIEKNIEVMKNNFLQQMVLEKEPLQYLKKF